MVIQEFPLKPISFKGRYFKRVKNSNHQLTALEIADLSMQSLQVSWDSYPAQNITIEDIDLKKVDRFIQKVNVIGRFKLEGSTIENLEKLRLISNNKITNAAYLLFAKKDILYNVHLGRFKTPSYIIDDKMLILPLFEAVEETMKYLISQIKVAFEITGKTTQRTEIFEYPLPALRELVLNAFIHRDYLSPVDVQIKVFDNRLLAEAFYLTGDIEKYGSGFKRIRNELLQYPTMNLECKEIPNGFLVELSYEEQKIQSEVKIIENVTENVTENRISLIIDLILENGKITTSELAKKLEVTRMTIARDIEILKQQKKIKRVGPDKGGHWKV